MIIEREEDVITDLSGIERSALNYLHNEIDFGIRSLYTYKSTTSWENWIGDASKREAYTSRANVWLWQRVAATTCFFSLSLSCSFVLHAQGRLVCDTHVIEKRRRSRGLVEQGKWVESHALLLIDARTPSERLFYFPSSPQKVMRL